MTYCKLFLFRIIWVLSLFIYYKDDPWFIVTCFCFKLFIFCVYLDYRVDPTDLHLSGLEAFSFDYVVKWPVSLVLNRKVCISEKHKYIHYVLAAASEEMIGPK